MRPGRAHLRYFSSEVTALPKAITERGGGGGERSLQRPGDALTERWAAVCAQVRAGRPALWCDRPPLDGDALAGRYLTVLGWAHAPAGVSAVTVELAGRRRSATLLGPRPEVTDALGITGLGFGTYLDLGGVPPGGHELVLSVRGADGATVEERAEVRVDVEAAYRAWLAGRPRRTPGAHRAAPPSAAVSVVGDDEASLLRAVAAGDLAFAVLFEHGVELDADAVERLADAFEGDAAPDVVYADERRVRDAGPPVLVPKPGWSPERLLATDYVGPLVALGARAARLALEGSGDTPPWRGVSDLVLDLVDAPLRVTRVPAPLYTTRGAVRADAREERLRAVARRRGRRLRLGPTGDVGWEVEGEPTVSAIVPSRNAGGVLDACLRSIAERTTYRALEVVVVDSSEAGIDAAALPLGAVPGRVVRYEGAFNFSRAINLGAKAATGDHLLVLNDDTEVLTPDWVERMLEHLQTPGVGIVGAKLVYPDGIIQHGGVCVSEGAAGAWHAYLGTPDGGPGWQGELLLAREAAAVTAACMLVRGDLYERLGGFDEAFPLDLGDTDICLRARELGARTVLTPHAVLVHKESTTRAAHPSSPPAPLAERWASRYEAGDPVEHPAFAPGHLFRAHEPDRALNARIAPGMETASERTGTVLTCEELPEDGATLYVHNQLVVRGWAESATGPPQVEVELDGSPLALATDDDASSPRLGFEARVDTSGWSPGARPITITARDDRGEEAVRHGIVDVLPFTVPPVALDGLQAELAAGRPVMSADEPLLDGSDRVVGHLAVNGWAYGPSGVRAVYITVDGRRRAEAVLGRRRPDLPRALGASESGYGGFGAVVDLHAVPPGPHHVSIVAVGADGAAVGREGTFLVERGEERPVSHQVDEEGRPLGVERFVPEEFRGRLVDAEHQARYRWARPAAAGAEVLDAGCGVGYGCAILAAGGARRVVGIDRSPEAVLNARERAGDVAEFVLGDLGELPFEDDAFDLVTCFEAIEHIVDPERALDELRRVLRPEGVLLISSPNRELFTPGNPFHVHEYTPDELQAALERRFADVRLFRQQAHLASLLGDDASFALDDADERLDAEVRKTSAAPEGELYSVAVAGDGELPELGNVVVLADVFDIRALFQTAWAWEEQAISARAEAEASRTEAQLADLDRERAHELLKESERARQEAEYWLADLKASASWRVTAPLREAKARAEGGRLGPLDAPARAVGRRLRNRLRG